MQGETPRPGLLRRYAWLETAGLGFLPGALLGVHLSLLLFFLNPDWTMGTGLVAGLATSYGLLVGSFGALLMVVLSRGQRLQARRLLPWGLTSAVALASLLAATHASRFAFFLPPGINNRLIKGALLIGAAALLLFYTSLLHSFSGRPYGLRSRWGILLICLASLYIMAERRAAYRPGPVPMRVRIPPPSQEAPKLLVVGIEGATLDALLPLAEQGRVPFLAEVLRSGATARLLALPPHRHLPAWTTLVTGKYPYRHGITDPRRIQLPGPMEGAELQLLPSGVGFVYWGLFGAEPRAVESGDQRSLALWQILQRRGVGSGLVGWPAALPVSQELGFALAEGFFAGVEDTGTAHPEGIGERARLFRVRADELDPVVLGRFGNDPPKEVQEALAADSWRQGLGLFLLEQQPSAEALFLTLPGLATVSRRYAGGFEAVQLEGSEDPEDLRAAELLAAYYGRLDTLLAELWSRSGREGLLAVVSPIGFSKLRGMVRVRRWVEGGEATEGTTSGAPDGVLMLYGDRVSPGTRLADASTVDLVPTLLYGLGYPVARDLDGKVLTAAFDTRWRQQQPLVFVPTYDHLPAAEGP